MPAWWAGLRMADLPQSLHARLRDALRADILEGRLRPGDKLASESEMQAEHGVSRITVRQALAALQADGLIVKLHGKGAFVSHSKASQSLNRLQGLHEALGSEAGTVSNRRLAWRQVKATAAVAAQLQLRTGEPVYQLQTLRYLEREPLSVNTSWLRPALGEKLGRVDFSRRDLIEVFEHEGGLAIGRAELEIGAGVARPADAKLLQIEAGAPVLEVQRIVYSDAGEPVHAETAVYRADTFRYRLALAR